MFVDIGTLRTGANDPRRAGWRADDGANHLAQTSLVTGKFGDEARTVATAFSEMDERNTSKPKATRCNFAT